MTKIDQDCGCETSFKNGRVVVTVCDPHRSSPPDEIVDRLLQELRRLSGLLSRKTLRHNLQIGPRPDVTVDFKVQWQEPSDL